MSEKQRFEVHITIEPDEGSYWTADSLTRHIEGAFSYGVSVVVVPKKPAPWAEE